MSIEHRGSRSPEMEVKYKKLSRINGNINKMNTFQIEKELERLRLEKSGNRDVLKKRLKNYHRRQILGGAADGDSQIMFKPFFSCFCVIDFEATCMEKNDEDFHHEIIEFPAVIVSVAERKLVAEFQSYCRPVVNPDLTEFCIELTGISQEQVDEAPLFSTVLTRFLLWLQEHEIKHKCKVGLVTHGAWDFGKFMFLQCLADKTEFPTRVKKWINIKKTFSNFYRCKKVSLEDMLAQQGLTFEGRLHSGLDDARNIARVLIGMLHDGATFRLNERIIITRNKHGERQAKIVPITRLQCLRQGIAPANLQRRSIAETDDLSDDDATLAYEGGDVTSDEDVPCRNKIYQDGDRFERVAKPRKAVVRIRTTSGGREHWKSLGSEENIQNGDHDSSGRYQPDRSRNESRRSADSEGCDTGYPEPDLCSVSHKSTATQTTEASPPRYSPPYRQPDQRFNRNTPPQRPLNKGNHSGSSRRRSSGNSGNDNSARNRGHDSDRGAWDDRSENVTSKRYGNETPAYNQTR